MSYLRLAAMLCTLMGTAAYAAPEFSSHPIFPAQDKHVHSSSIVQLPDGSFIACWFHGSGERSSDDVKVQGARLKKGASEWGPVFLMTDTPNVPDCNPVLFVDQKGRLWLFWIAVRANRWETSILKYLRAEDPSGEGVPNWNWQDVIIPTLGDEFPKALDDGFKALDYDDQMWAEYAPQYDKMIVEAAKDKGKRQQGWMTRTHPITLASGRILLPLYSDGFNASLVGISDDMGETWTMSLPMVGLGPIQPTVVPKKDGTLVAYMRDSGASPGRAMRSTSSDNGSTWSPAIDSDILNPGSSLEVIALKDGRWLLIYNDADDGRHTLAVALSSDEGQTWSHTRHLEKVERGKGGFAYPSIIQSADGAIHATYSHSAEKEGKFIKHATFNTEWIEAGDK